HNIDDGFQGAAPDLGAVELGCDPPAYGVRPAGIDETNEPLGCTMGAVDGDGVPIDNNDAGTTGGGKSGGCCPTSSAPDGSLLLFGLFLVARFARRCRR